MERSLPSTQPQRPVSRLLGASEAPTTELAFVSITHPDQVKDRKTQTKIHRHVMKDIGRARRREPRNKQIVLNLVSEESSWKETITSQPSGRRPARYGSTFPESHQGPTLENLPLMLSSTISSPFVDRPLSARLVGPRTQGLLKDFSVCRTWTDQFYSLAMIDDIIMYMALAESALDTDPSNLKSGEQEHASALQHYTASLGVLNERVRNVSIGLGDATISGVIALSCYDLRARNFTRWAIHMAGLQRMIEARGGLENLTSRSLQRFLIWSDLLGSLSLDLPPRFAVSVNFLQQTPKRVISPVLDMTISMLQQRFHGLSDICLLLASLSDLAKTANEAPSRVWNKDANLTQTFGLVVCGTLTLPRHEIPLNHDDNSFMVALAMREVLRLASLFFLTAPVDYLASDRNVDTNQRGRMPKLLRSYTLDWSGLEALELWVLVIDALIERDEDREWIMNRIKYTMRKNKLNWQGVLQVLGQIAWIEGLLSQEVDKLETDLDTVGPFSES